MLKKSLLIPMFISIQIGILSAAIPTGYYNNADGKNTSALHSALTTIITTNHSVTSYNGLYTAYGTTDVKPSTDSIWDMYSNCKFIYGTDENHGTTGPECTNYNREHTTPASWFSNASPMYSDLFNVYPTDSYVNNMRSNNAYGEVGTASYTSGNGSKLGNCNFTGYSGTVFEPIDEYKGDFARTYFYMATRYIGVIPDWISNNSALTDVDVIYGGTYGLSTYAVNLYLTWSRLDPVSAKEIARNDAVYGIQHNRNPYIDYPGLEEYIWGNKTSQTFSISGGTATAPTVTTPTSSSVTSSSATLGGNITDAGTASITESGIYYSTTNGFSNGTGTKVAGSATTTGTFTVAVSGLSASTVYYYKAYATNSAGTGYSTQGTFTTGAASGGGSPSIEAVKNIVTSGSELAFGTVTKAVTKNFLVKTTDITGNLTVSLSASTMFTVSPTSITQAEAEAGKVISVIFNPTAAGSYTGTLIISGGGLPSNYVVNLSGNM